MGDAKGSYYHCFQEDTNVTRNDGKNLSVNELSIGDKILSKNPNDEKFHDEVAKFNVLKGKFAALKFIMEDGNFLTVTTSHIMMILKDEKLLATIAKDVCVNDMMKMANGEMKEVVEIQEIVLDKVIQVMTKSGLMYANGILTTGTCEEVTESVLDSNIVQLFSSSRQYALQFKERISSEQIQAVY